MDIKQDQHKQGRFRVFTHGQIIVSHIIGQWTVQTALKHEEALHQAVSELSERKFAHLLYFDDWQLHTPEVFPIIERMIDWLISQGQCCAAEVFSHDALKNFLLDKLIEEIKESFTVRRFSSEQEALRWLAEKGFESRKISLIA